MERPHHNDLVLGSFEWEPEIGGWVRRVDVTLNGRREEILLSLNGVGRTTVTAGQSALARRIVSGLLAERWPEVQRRGKSAWDVEAKRSGTWVSVVDERRWVVHLYRHDLGVPNAFSGTPWHEASFEDEVTPEPRPLYVSDHVLQLVEWLLQAEAVDEIEAQLEELFIEVIDPMDDPGPRRANPVFERAQRLLRQWVDEEKLALDEHADLDALTLNFLSVLSRAGGAPGLGGRVAQWLVAQHDVADVFASDEDLEADLRAAASVEEPPQSPQTPDAATSARTNEARLNELLRGRKPQTREAILDALRVRDKGEAAAAEARLRPLLIAESKALK